MAETYNEWLKLLKILVIIKILFTGGYLSLPLRYIHV